VETAIILGATYFMISSFVVCLYIFPLPMGSALTTFRETAIILGAMYFMISSSLACLYAFPLPLKVLTIFVETAIILGAMYFMIFPLFCLPLIPAAFGAGIDYFSGNDNHSWRNVLHDFSFILLDSTSFRCRRGWY